MGSVLLFLGALCMAFAEGLPFDAYIIAQFLLAFGGTFIFVPSFHLSNAFPQFQGLVLALITGAFDASAAVFLVLRLVYQASDGGFGMRRFFLAYLAVPLLTCVCHLTFMPRRSYETRAELGQDMERAKNPMQDLHDSDNELTDGALWRVRSERQEERQQTITEISDLLGTREEQKEHAQNEEKIRVRSGVWGVLQ